MDPLTLIVSALVAGALAVSQTGTPQAVKASYAGLQALLARSFGQYPDLLDAVAKVAARPESASRQGLLQEELAMAQADQDQALVAAARQLLALLAQQDATASPHYQATNRGSGALAQGSGAVAAGQGGVASGGNVSGSTIVTGSGNIVGSHNRVTRVTETSSIHNTPLATRHTLLLLAANPVDRPQLQLDEETRAIDQALRQGALRERFDLRPHAALRLADLQELLLRYQPTLLHFSGHGTSQHELLVQDERGQSVAMPGPALSDLFRTQQRTLRCVVLNACYSATQAAALAEHIDCVIGTPALIGDAAALQFATAFYRALAYGETVATAFAQAVAQVALYDLPTSAQPVLLGKSDPTQVRLGE